MKKIAALVSLLLALGQPALAGVYKSTVTLNTVNSNVTTKAGVLHKVIVSSAGATGGYIAVKNNRVGNVSTLTVVDCAAQREIEYDVFFSSGLSYVVSGPGDARIVLLYSEGSPGTPTYKVHHTTANATAQNISTKGIILHKVVVSKAGTSPSLLTLYNNRLNGSTANEVLRVDGDAISDVTYDLYLSSGLTFTVTNGAKVSILYREY